jgi:hypothetical protein
MDDGEQERTIAASVVREGLLGALKACEVGNGPLHVRAGGAMELLASSISELAASKSELVRREMNT